LGDRQVGKTVREEGSAGSPHRYGMHFTYFMQTVSIIPVFNEQDFSTALLFFCMFFNYMLIYSI
jgi:hypothetical protein